jgi:hypothetical protein
MAFTGVGCYWSREVEMGAEELHDIQLLLRYKTISTGFTSRVQPLLKRENYAAPL